MNIFFQDYYSRLRYWHELRERLSAQDIKTICVEVDGFWQQVPLLSRYLHPDEIDLWPNPWTLLNDNNYCLYARGLAIYYTLEMLGVNSIDFVSGTDDTDEDAVLVIVYDENSDTKYVLNWNPKSVIGTDLSQFNIKIHLDTKILKNNLGNQ